MLSILLLYLSFSCSKTMKRQSLNTKGSAPSIKICSSASTNLLALDLFFKSPWTSSEKESSSTPSNSTDFWLSHLGSWVSKIFS